VAHAAHALILEPLLIPQGKYADDNCAEIFHTKLPLPGPVRAASAHRRSDAVSGRAMANQGLVVIALSGITPLPS